MKLKRAAWALPLILLYASSRVWTVQVRLAGGTPVRVRLKSDLTSKQARAGDRVDFEVARPTIAEGLVVITEGAIAWGAVQAVKKGKEIQFDIEAVRLPSLVEVKLRTAREKTNKSSKAVIKIGSQFGDDVGMARGSEFTAYVDEDVEVEAARPPAALPPASSPAPAAPVSQGMLATGERVTVEFFSEPSGADILIDDDFVGNTPSILKVTLGEHRLEIQLADYKPYSQPLTLTPSTRIRTIRVSLQKKN